MDQAGNRALPGIAVVSHNSAADLRRTLAGHARAASTLGVPLAVVDNASTDGSVEFLDSFRERAPRTILTLQPRNLGYAGAVNLAFSLLAGRDVLVLNPDVELANEAPVLDLAAHLAKRPAVGVCAPRLLFADGSVQPSARRPASLAAMAGSLRLGSRVGALRRSYQRYLSPSVEPGAGEVDWVIGAAMLIRRRAFEGVEGMDTGFFLYMEDADFCRRLRRAGWEVSYVPRVTLRHDYARASSAEGASALSSAARRRHFVSLARYWGKHPGALFGRGARPGRRPQAEPTGEPQPGAGPG